MKKIILLLTVIILATSASSAVLQATSCNVNTQVKEITLNNPLDVTLTYVNSAKAINEATISCGNDLEQNAKCTYDSQMQSGTCKSTCTYEKQGVYQINGQIPNGNCGASKIEAFEVSEQTFQDNEYLDFLADSSAAQVNVLKITTVPSIVREDKTEVVNISARNRIEITSITCNSLSKNKCQCDITSREKTRTELSCSFAPPVKGEYTLTFSTRDRNEKTFSLQLNSGQAAVLYAPQTGPNFTLIGAIIVVIILIAAGAYFGLKQLERQASAKDDLNAAKKQVEKEIANLKASNSKGELSDEDLELILVDKNAQLDEIEKQIKIEEEKLKEN